MDEYWDTARVELACADVHRRYQLLPHIALRATLRQPPPGMVKQLTSELRAGEHLHPTEEVLAWKQRHGLRHLAVLDVAQEVALTALSTSAREGDAIEDRATSSFDDFLHAPLAAGDGDFVVITDVQNYYRQVVHEVLDRTLIRSGVEFDVAEALMGTLGAMTDYGVGLPQVCHGSDVLSEIYIAPIERSMKRRGYSCWRYNDDFRFRVHTYTEARRAIVDLAAELSRIGLAAGDAKTHIVSVEKYAEWIGSSETERRPIGLPEDHAEDVTKEEEGEYSIKAYVWIDEIDDMPSSSQAPEAAWEEVEAVFADWLRSVSTGGTDASLASVKRQGDALADALGVLSRARSAGALEHIGHLIAQEPHLTPHVSAYLSSLGADDADQVSGVLEERSSQIGAASSWQQAWLLQPVVAGVPPGPKMVNLLESLVDSFSSTVAGRAARALARHGRWSAPDVLAATNGMPRMAESDAIWGLLQAGAFEEIDRTLRARPHVRWLEHYFGSMDSASLGGDGGEDG